MFKKYLLLFILFIFSFNVLSANIEHNCHEEMKMEMTHQVEMEKDCDCCENQKIITTMTMENCDCDNCEMSQTAFVTHYNYQDNFKEYYKQQEKHIFFKQTHLKNMYKPPIFS
jgi:hypothetical protein